MEATIEVGCPDCPKLPSLPTQVIASSGEEWADIHSPFDGQEIARVPLSSNEDVYAAFSRARTAQKAWAEVSLVERRKVAARFGKLVLGNRTWLLDLLQLETGKARSAAFEEVVDLPLWSGYVYHNAVAHLAPRKRRGALPVLTQTVERRVPHGVVGIITPWNYPLTLPGTDSLPALVAGNAVVLKPDSLTPLTGIAVANLLRKAGVPRDVLQVVIGPGSRVGELLTSLSDFVTFTGSTRTGERIATKCAERLVGFAAELGGKNPLLVLDDADVEAAAFGATQACFANAGQLCISIERIYVTEKHWQRFLSAFVRNVEQLRLAPGFDWKTDVGSLASAAQLEKVSSHVEDARKKGASVEIGGRPRPDLGPYFYAPTILTGVTPDMEIFAHETFGPVVSVYKVASDEAALAVANNSDYGLNASVWSRSGGREIANQIQSGTVNVNDGYGAAWASYGSPMGGMKLSGIGRRHGVPGLQKYTQAQTVAVQHVVPVSGPRWLSHEAWSQVLTAGAKVMRHLP